MSIKIDGIYRHKKRGGKYKAEGLMKLQISPETIRRIAPLLSLSDALHVSGALERVSFVSYSSIDDDSQIFGRPESEFLDGRFEEPK